MKSMPAHQAAFTLVELLVTLMVFCIILVLALPALSTLLMNNRLKANTDLFVNALNYARNTALTQSINVMVCPLGALGSTACGSNWNSGWIVITQPASGANALLQTQQAGPKDPILSGSVSSVLFDPHGLATTQNNFTLCDNRGSAFAHSVEVLATGFIQSGATAGQAVWNNGALTCP